MYTRLTSMHTYFVNIFVPTYILENMVMLAQFWQILVKIGQIGAEIAVPAFHAMGWLLRF